MTRLDNRVAFVTGVARGQGRSHAVRLAEEGADIIGVDLGTGVGSDIDTTAYPLATDDDLAETAALVEKTGRRAVLRKADVRDVVGLAAALQEGVDVLGRLDVVVANAGIFSVGPLAELPEKVWRDIIDINLTGVWHTVKVAVPHLRAGARGGSIILTTSGTGVISPPGIGHYAAAKAAVISLTHSLANELGPEWIRVNAVAPGNVDTPMIDNPFTRKLFFPNLDNPTKADAQEPGSPYLAMGALQVPWVEAADVSTVVAFLASDDSHLITGAVVPIDAGYLVKK